LSAADGYIHFLSTIPGSSNDVAGYKQPDHENYPPYSNQELVVTQLRDPIRYPLLDEIRRLLNDWTIFRGFGEGALKNVYESQLLDITEPLRLDAQGRNLVSVLHAIANDTKYAEADDALRAILASAFDDFSKLDVRTLAAGRVGLYWRTQNRWQFPASQMSDGMLRFLGLATLLLLPDPPSLIAIDEPEVGLHPELIPLLAGLLKKASAHTQLIVATHSPQLLNAEAIELDDIVVVEREAGRTTLDRPDSERLRLWLERYTLGNLWVMGKLEQP
jgi:predicted ATPase